MKILEHDDGETLLVVGVTDKDKKWLEENGYKYERIYPAFGLKYFYIEKWVKRHV